MTKKCCIPTCKVESDQPEGRDLTFHTVPNDMREKWTELLQTQCNVELKKYSYICSLHFQPGCFYYSGLCKNRRLKKGSCPTLFGDKLNTQLDDQSGEIQATDNHDEDDTTFNVSVEASSPSSSVYYSIDYDITGTQKVNNTDLSTSEKFENNSTNTKERKSILHMDLDSLNISGEAKKLLEKAKEEVLGLRRRNRQLQMRLYRSRKGVKSATTLFTHMKKRKLISENLHNILEAKLPLRKISAMSSAFGGQGMKQCNCKKYSKGQCLSNKCNCKKEFYEGL
ncbi:unnamed protein product [Parnassius apollo]|uniref:(apollo) hypothetical protein n=1 Tax=Parnassius apollo TaxID=110799 RepID=A0A8S3YA24_PARAO|nr:unnamed protein product [Parnassius apollo]